MSYGTRVQAISQVTDRKPLPSKIPYLAKFLSV